MSSNSKLDPEEKFQKPPVKASAARRLYQLAELVMLEKLAKPSRESVLEAAGVIYADKNRAERRQLHKELRRHARVKLLVRAQHEANRVHNKIWGKR